MANEATILRIRAQVENLEGLNRARSAVRNFATESKAASNDLDKLRSLFKELGAESVRSVNNLKNYRTGLDALRQSAQIGSTTFNELTSEIKQLDIELGSLQGKQAQVASGFNKIASSANAAATATRRQFDLSGAGVNFGKTTVAGKTYTIRDTKGQGQPFGPQAIDYAAVNKGLTQAVQAEEQLTELSRRARMERLLNAEKYNNLEIAAADKKAREELRIQQQGNARAEADFDRRLANRTKKRGNLRRFGQTAGAVAASGVFGGPEGLIGAGFGAIGGPGGALAGGAIGAQVGMIRQFIASMAEYAAQIGRLQIALQGVTKTSDEYASAQEVISRISKDLNVPILEATKGFTRLSASVLGAGGKVSDAAVVFRAFTQAVKATGGGAEEVNGVMTALTQIFSKGKISAEEINQIAERLPGAFTVIASATGRTGFELQEALKKGEVGLNDLMKTADYLTTQYSASADRMAKSTDDAGARMKVALDELGKTFGNFFKPIGAGFQDFITQIVTATNKMIEMAQLRAALGKTVSFGEQVENNKTAMRIAELRYPNNPEKQRSETYKINQELQANSLKRMGIEAGIVKIPSALAATERTVFTSPKGDDTVDGGTKTAENAAKRLADRTKEQLADAKALYKIEEKKYELSVAMNEREKLDAEYNKTKAEIAREYDKLLRDSLSKEETKYIIGRKSFALEGARQKLEIDKLDILKKENRELYAQVGLSATLNKNLQAALAGAFDGGTATGTFRTDVDLMPGLTGGELGSKIEELKKSLADLQDPIKQVMAGAQAIGEAFSTSFKGLIDGSMSAQEALAGFFKSIANHFLDMASQMIAKYIEMQIIGLAQQFLPSIGGIFGPSGAPNFSGASVSVPNQYAYGGGTSIMGSANGNVFAQNGIVPYAKGGIVDRPMMFPFAKGIGLMGEAGPEAIMPLKRGADGKLGVAGGGGGGTSVVVNVDASGSRVEGDQAQGKQLGVAISAAVQAELVKQQRPGGLLANTRR
jgi:tape measure domain-containing protein